jgi:hypothetical protein
VSDFIFMNNFLRDDFFINRIEENDVIRNDIPDNDKMLPGEIINSILNVYNECVLIPDTNMKKIGQVD